MKKFTLLITGVFFTIQFFGQNILFTSEFGGENSNGAIMNYDVATDQLNTFKSLGGNFQYGYSVTLNPLPAAYADYSNGLVKGQDGYYYGVNELASGIYSRTSPRGVFYRLHPDTHEMEILHSFTGHGEFALDVDYGQNAYNFDLKNPVFSVVEASSGVFYGIARVGGVNNWGGIWKYDVNTSTYSKVGDFTSATGAGPLSPLEKGAGNDFYGILQNKDGSSYGYVYKVNTSTDVLSYVGNLNPNAGASIYDPKGSIVYISSTNRIYGVKRFGGDLANGGGVYYYDLNNNEAHHVAQIPLGSTSILGNNPNGLVQANDGHMYFTCPNGGSTDNGTLVRFIPGNNTITKVYDFNDSPVGVGYINAGSHLIGTYDNAASSGNAIWAYDVGLGSMTVHLAVSSSSPGYYLNSFLAYDAGSLIGHFKNGGPQDAGSVFEYNLGQQQTTLIQNNGSPAGRSFVGEMLNMNDTVLIAYVGLGGDDQGNDHSENGYMANINIHTGDITKLNAFASSKSYHDLKTIQPILADNGKLYYCYYTSLSSGRNFHLTEYDFDTDTHQNILLFTAGIANEAGPLEFAPNKVAVGINDNLFVYDVSTQTMDVNKITHDNSVYGDMRGRLILASDGKLYGMTKATNEDPTTGHDAVLYSLDVTNFDFTVEHTFDNAIRNANIALSEYNGKLYGSTNFEGGNGEGFLFSFDISSGTFTNEYDFSSGTTGAGFEAAWTENNGKLYSTSYTGGAFGYGTLVEFDPASGLLTVLQDLTIENGRAFRGSPIAVGLPVLDSIVPNFADQNQVINCTIYGTNTLFDSNSDPMLTYTGDPTEIIHGTVVSVTSATELVVEFDIPLNASLGLWDLAVGTAELMNAFTVSQVYPSLLYMDPDYAEQGETVSTEIIGENTPWTQATPSVYLSNHDNPNYIIPAYNISVVSDEELDADFDIPANALSGNYDLHVDTLTLVNGFAVLLPNVPVLNSINPDNEMQGNTVVCTIEAFYTTFTQGGTPTVFLKSQVNPSETIPGYDVTIISDTELEATFDIPYLATTGLYELNVDALVLIDAFTVTSVGGQLLTIHPDSAFVGEIIPVEITSTGTYFIQQGINSVKMTYNQDPTEILNAISYSAVNDTLVEAVFGFPANTSLGMWDVYVDNYSLVNGFKVVDYMQQIISIDPDSAYQGDFMTISIETTGTLFEQQQPMVSMNFHDDPSQLINAIDVYVVNDTLIEAEFGFPYSISAGSWDVNVDNMTEENAFTVLLVTDIGELENSHDLSVYPNPFTDKIYFESKEKILSIDLYNTYGDLLINTEPDDFSISISTQVMSPGIYFVRALLEDGKIVTRKLIKK
jgi:uncharacterized repeat protein (TIGR03803 family)